MREKAAQPRARRRRNSRTRDRVLGFAAGLAPRWQSRIARPKLPVPTRDIRVVECSSWPSVGRAKVGARSRSSRCRNTRTRRRCDAVEKQLASYPPLVFAGEARNLKKRARPGRAGRGFPAAGRRLRRELHRSERQQHQRQQHPRLPARVPADGGGADLCRRGAGGEGRPHRRPVRQAALVADREEERPGAAELSRRHHQRHRSSPPRRARPIRRG